MERLIVEQLILGPYTEGVRATLAPETRVLNILVQDGICYVDLSEEVMNGMDGVTAEAALYSIVNSLTETPSTRRVQFYVAGENSRRFLDQIPITGEFERNNSLIAGN